MIISFVMHKKERERENKRDRLSRRARRENGRHRVCECSALASGSCHSSPGRVREQNNAARAQIAATITAKAKTSQFEVDLDAFQV
jgi:hypothetical protein